MIKSHNFGFNHIFINSYPDGYTNKEYDEGSKKLTFVLLHGTGGNEEDLIFLGKKIEPNATMLSPRGKVLENNMPRFFRRLSEGVFDIEDLKIRSHELADFIQKCSFHYKFNLEKTNAITTLKWQSSSHNLIQDDILVAKSWISNNFPAK